jgi:hypothetical protein
MFIGFILCYVKCDGKKCSREEEKMMDERDAIIEAIDCHDDDARHGAVK